MICLKTYWLYGRNSKVKTSEETDRQTGRETDRQTVLFKKVQTTKMADTYRSSTSDEHITNDRQLESIGSPLKSIAINNSYESTLKDLNKINKDTFERQNVVSDKPNDKPNKIDISLKDKNMRCAEHNISNDTNNSEDSNGGCLAFKSMSCILC